MVIRFKPALPVIAGIVMMMLILGCSGKTDPIFPGSEKPTAPADQSIYGGESFRADYTLSLDANTVTGQIEKVSRDTALDATRFLNVSLASLEWDPIDRIWDIVVQLQNPTPYDCYRPWMVFTNLGQQELLNQDEFIWISGGLGLPATRCPIVELDKASPKLFAAKSTESLHLRLHWPQGVDSFSPIEFFIDASFPSFRNHPEIVSIDPHRDSSLSRTVTITVHVLDLQTPPEGVVRMTAWVDLRALGVPDKCYVDGLQSSDIGVAVCDVDPAASGKATLHVLDWQGYGIEQDFFMGDGSVAPCPQAREAASGMATGRRQYAPVIIRKQLDCDDLWAQLGQLPPAPQMSPDEMFVFLCPGPMNIRESPTKQSLSLTCASLDPVSNELSIQWRLADGPDEDCDGISSIADLHTPFSFFALPAIQFGGVQFQMERTPSSCPAGSCTSYRELGSGELSKKWGDGHVTLMKFQDEVDLVWRISGAPGAPPQLGDGEVAAMVIGDEEPTTGHELLVGCVTPPPDGTAGKVSMQDFHFAPDSSCAVEQRSSTPFVCVAFASANPLFDQDCDFTTIDELSRCASDTCEPAKTFAEGTDSAMIVPYFDILCSSTQLRAFWSLHKPGEAPPAFDFSTGAIIVVCDGLRQTTGFSLSLDCASVITDPTGVPVLDVALTEHVPEPASCPVEPIPTSPFLFVQINRPTWTDSHATITPSVYTCP